MALSDKLEQTRKKVQKKKEKARRFKLKQKGKVRASDRRVRKNNPKNVLEGVRASARQTKLLAGEVGVTRENASKAADVLSTSTDLNKSSEEDTDDILSKINDGLGGGLDEGQMDDQPVDAVVDFGEGGESFDALGGEVDFGTDFGTGADDPGAGVSFEDDL